VSDVIPTTDNSVFEGLFAKLLKPEGAFKADLRAAGYDVDNPKLRYPTSTLLDALGIAARHVYPELSREDAFRQLGRRFADRYLTTILGRITRTLILALGVDKFLMQMPKIVALSSTGISARVQPLAPGEFQITFTGDHLCPDFIAGSLEGGAKDVSIFNLRAEVIRRDPGEFEVKITGLRK
jgi:uncharacterized protein (TIGR02265 family)